MALRDDHVVGSGKSGGQAALFFSTHARSVPMMCRGPAIERTMSRYLVDQIAARPNIRVRTRTTVVQAHGEASLEAIEIENSETGARRRLESGGLFLFIGANAETAWLPDEISRDP